MSPVFPDDHILINGFQVLEINTPELLEIQIHLKVAQEGFTIVSHFQ